MKKKFLLILIVITVILGIYFFINRKYILGIPNIISSYYSKVFCSCYYVMKQTEEYCHNYTKQWIPISKFIHDKDKKKVTVKKIFWQNSAYYVNNKKGCFLEPY